MRKTLLLSLVFCKTILAFEIGSFDSYKANTGYEETTLAVIDNSDFSKEWLEKNATYLTANKIPLLVINATQEETNNLNSSYNGLLAGVVPEPVEFMKYLMSQMGVKYYPAVIENGQIWQSKSN